MSTVENIAKVIVTPFTVWDCAKHERLLSAPCYDYCTLPDDVRSLKVEQIYAVDDLIYIDVNTSK